MKTLVLILLILWLCSQDKFVKSRTSEKDVQLVSLYGLGQSSPHELVFEVELSPRSILHKILDRILGPCKVVLFSSFFFFFFVVEVGYYRCIDKFVLEICFMGLAALFALIIFLFG